MSDDIITKCHLILDEAGVPSPPLSALDRRVRDLADAYATRNDRAARIEKAARAVLDLYEQDKMDSLGFCERRMVAMKALTDALEAP